MTLPPHRRLIWLLETALACLDEAVEADAGCGVLPHWARSDLREMVDQLQDLLERVAREAPAVLGALSEAEWEDDGADEP
jgi:hypothetical protein